MAQVERRVRGRDRAGQFPVICCAVPFPAAGSQQGGVALVCSQLSHRILKFFGQPDIILVGQGHIVSIRTGLRQQRKEIRHTALTGSGYQIAGDTHVASGRDETAQTDSAVVS